MLLSLFKFCILILFNIIAYSFSFKIIFSIVTSPHEYITIYLYEWNSYFRHVLHTLQVISYLQRKGIVIPYKMVHFMSNIIKQLRKKIGLSQEQLARKCNIDQSHLSLLENEKVNPSIPTAHALAKVFNICATEIMNYYTCLACPQRNKCCGDCFKAPTRK